MLIDVGPVAADAELTMNDVRTLYGKLAKYFSGFLIYFQGAAYPDYKNDLYPIVTVTKVERVYDSFAPKVDLGATNDRERQTEDVLSEVLRRKSVGNENFLLSWEGNKIPRGAVINGKTIAWTQHGRVISDTGQEIGTYERLAEFGGESGREQKMIVFAR
jgi:hypothetical protein